MKFLLPILLASISCAPAVQKPQSAPPAVVLPEPTQERCAEAERLRRLGFDQMAKLDLKNAHESFHQALMLDPGNAGALHQMQVIENIENSPVAGASEETNRMASQVYPSQCALLESQTPVAVAPPAAKPVVQTDKAAEPTDTAQNSQPFSDEPPPQSIKEGVEQTMRKLQPDFRRCYGDAVLQQRSLTGSVVVKFSVDESGHVSHTRTEGGTLKDQKVESCIKKTVNAAPFPKVAHGGKISVTYPIAFSLDNPS